MHNNFSACCAHKCETGTGKSAQVLHRTEKWSFALSHPGFKHWSQDLQSSDLAKQPTTPCAAFLLINSMLCTLSTRGIDTHKTVSPVCHQLGRCGRRRGIWTGCPSCWRWQRSWSEGFPGPSGYGPGKWSCRWSRAPHTGQSPQDWPPVTDSINVQVEESHPEQLWHKSPAF